MRSILALFLILSAAVTFASERTSINLDTGWRFIKGDTPTLEDSKWSSVTVPHCYNAQDGQDGGANYYRGPAWYRRRFALPAGSKGREVFLDFQGVNRVADVLVNGKPVGRHVGGYTAFRFDITNLVDFTGDNVLSVRVDNGADPDIPPLSGDFTFFGGIYRPVKLILADKLHLDLLDFAGPGVYVRTSSVDSTSAILHIESKVSNDLERLQSAVVRFKLHDKLGRLAAEGAERVSVDPHSVSNVAMDITVPSPHLWQGRADPYLYTLTADLQGPDSTDTDEVTVPVGIRTYRVDPNTGFWLNGKHVDLHGVNKHQDRLGKGYAVSPQDEDEDFAIIADLGATMVRLAHYPHSSHEYDLCDRYGIVAWAEVPLVNRISDSESFSSSAKQQLAELIHQQYNHPSICFWSLFNEITNEKGPKPAPLLAEMDDLTHLADPSRSTTAGASSDPRDPTANVSDVVAYNRYYAWYYGKFADLAPFLDKTHSQFPKRSFGMSEYGAGAGVDTHSESPKENDHSEEYQCIFHEHYWAELSSRPFVWCKLVWAMFDFGSDGRKEGEHPGRNDKGLVTYDRKTKKDAFYFYKANWSKEPFVHLCSKRMRVRASPSVTIKVYSSLPSVDLIVNGRSLGRVNGSHGTFIWKDVLLIPGDNRVRAISGSFADETVWTRR